MVRERGLEPPPLAGPDPKSGVSAISPLALDYQQLARQVLRRITLYPDFVSHASKTQYMGSFATVLLNL